jgi:hypothetical protein
LLQWFQQSCEGNASIDGRYLKEKVLHIAAHPGIATFSASSNWIERFKRRHNIVYRTLSVKGTETIEEQKNG